MTTAVPGGMVTACSMARAAPSAAANVCTDDDAETWEDAMDRIA